MAPPSCLHFCSVPFSFSNLFSLSPISSFLYIAAAAPPPLPVLLPYSLRPSSSVISLTNALQTPLPRRPRELPFLLRGVPAMDSHSSFKGSPFSSKGLPLCSKGLAAQEPLLQQGTTLVRSLPSTFPPRPPSPTTTPSPGFKSPQGPSGSRLLPTKVESLECSSREGPAGPGAGIHQISVPHPPWASRLLQAAQAPEDPRLKGLEKTQLFPGVLLGSATAASSPAVTSGRPAGTRVPRLR